MAKQTELRKKRIEELMIGCRDNTVDVVLNQFGVTRALFRDRLGGNIATPHNAANGIFPNEKVETNYAGYGEKFDRAKYDDPIARRKVRTAQAPTGRITDAYTERKRNRPNVEQDHIVPLKEGSTHEWMHCFCTEDQRIQILNAPSNLALTSKKINRSKGGGSARKFIESGRAKKHGADPSKVRQQDMKAHTSLNVKVARKGVEQVGKEAGAEAAKLATRQAVGMLMTELILTVYEESVDLYQLKAAGKIIDWHSEISARSIKLKDRLSARAADVRVAFVEGGVSGLISSLVTWFINMAWTTAKHIVSALREAIVALVRAFRVVFFSGPEVPVEVKIREAAKIIAGAGAIAGGLILDEVLKHLLATVPVLQAFAPEVSAVVSAILTGLVTALAIFIIDRVFDHLQYPLNAELVTEVESNLALQEKLIVIGESSLTDFQGILRRLETMIDRNDAVIDTYKSIVAGEAEGLSKLRRLKPS